MRELSTETSDWHVCVDHPIVLYSNIHRPCEFIVESLVEVKRKKVLFSFDRHTLVAANQLEPLKQNH